MNGKIWLDRKMLNWEWFDDSNVVHLWIYILLRANWKDEQWHGIVIKRGQAYITYPQISKATGLSQKEIRTALSKLKTTGEISTERAGKGQLVTVEKYDDYQAENNAQGTKGARKGHDEGTIGARLGHQMNKDNKENKDNNIYIGDVQPPAKVDVKPIRKVVPPMREWVVEYIAANNLRVDPDAFWDYYEARAWKNKQGKVKDWQATLRTWSRNEYSKPRQNNENPFVDILKGEIF